ncbi:mesaconyl-C4 CoA hydratase, variant [Blastomyces dermatitidis ER-3]|uniref:Mesaconyl-C4 CoA hydratase n=2 Tax=Ajellomyces dermatitidis TaxID=5039 RepID=F2TGP3_AJEDA|nr:mesaconyl-C4 CoA hydratase [Blastomyces dermatitidis ER-3]XP_045282678.1 mesaconyl-C4 CoA hydratase, variant [Blastomyces dermatitidis ER-3]EGE82406.1 mesaconyl-C4 CoA hydratase [Blastomyces dermatitidis ATCC 18188]EQL35012.1 mesaconyl-C4 CoA hydratase [Blastomyces dermatitidis ATCC 26199]EQL35013.1 mesaconyl-C4 CoA hydratase, variant [Blastomyces dermatitidis ATCC 26199]KMW67779.1 mesaconyl-C4 CoA hydratase, variant [Blastomyces dermatitidis ATCC 18188]OAT02950.1 mesaconyl-C4 CoA hydratas
MSSSLLYPSASSSRLCPFLSRIHHCHRSTYNQLLRSLTISQPAFQYSAASSSSTAAAPYSTTSAPTASTIASNFLSRFQSLGPQTRTQILDANQLQLLSLTLNRNSLYPGSPALSNARPPEAGTPIPPGHHLVYFTPTFLEGELGADGTDASYNPEAPFTRRMWAGGEVRWPRGRDGRVNLLRVGQEVRETTRMLSAEAKVVRKTGEEMVVVGVEKVFENENGVAVVDRRNWVFREALKHDPSTQAAPVSFDNAPPAVSNTRKSTAPPTFSTSKENNTVTHTRTLCQSAVTLFRFSALTFNGHKIHYSLPWAQEVEGHPGLVVHGPLNLISILDLWRDVRAAQKGNQGAAVGEIMIPEGIVYRATSPLYAEEEYRIVLEEAEGGGDGGNVNIYSPAGTVAMKAEITA